MMYKNLCTELFVKGVTKEDLSKLLKIHNEEIEDKLSGASDFRLLEVLAIRDTYLKGASIDYMMETEK